MHVLALADDTTGALEVGAQFAGERLRSLVAIEPEPDLAALGAAADAPVVDTATRHLPARDAGERVGRLAAAARRLGVGHVYKKTDSTLRGNIASEVRALLAAFPDRPLVYVPAYPKLGRVVADGRLYVDGAPLAETPFSEDRLNPSRWRSVLGLFSGEVPALLARDAGALADLLRGAIAGVIVCDGDAEEHLESAASVLAAANRPCLVAGTGGFAGHWIRSLPVPRRAAPGRPRVSRCLVVNGSMHPASRAQVRHAGLPTFQLAADPAGDAALAEAIARKPSAEPRATASSRWAVLSTPEQPAGSPAEVAARVGAVVRQVLQHTGIDGLIISGGDTARAVLDALGACLIEPCGELLPGVPLSLIRGRAVALVTKAGGFGAPDTIAAIRRILEEPA